MVEQPLVAYEELPAVLEEVPRQLAPLLCLHLPLSPATSLLSAALSAARLYRCAAGISALKAEVPALQLLVARHLVRKLALVYELSLASCWQHETADLVS